MVALWDENKTLLELTRIFEKNEFSLPHVIYRCKKFGTYFKLFVCHLETSVEQSLF
jgi:hypothetical protein